jgi:hypothetical protein
MIELSESESIGSHIVWLLEELGFELQTADRTILIKTNDRNPMCPAPFINMFNKYTQEVLAYLCLRETQDGIALGESIKFAMEMKEKVKIDENKN